MNENKLVMGILAHVDAGKTTLSESILYLTGSIRKLGRVDHQNTFLDTEELERARGITIFSKQARFSLGEKEVTLLDTPGHVDFSAEMERTLQVLDYAILVISGADGVQSHTRTLWKLLSYYKIPVFLFVNKMDQDGTDRKELLKDLQNRLDERCVDFTVAEYADSSQNIMKEKESTEVFWDNLSLCHESLLEEYLETGRIAQETLKKAIAQRQVFPCYFGSALKVEGVSQLLDGIKQYCICPQYPEKFAAKIYKITRDSQGNRLTHMKITGGSLKVKSLLTNNNHKNNTKEDNLWQEKVDQIRIYSGNQFQLIHEAVAGEICSVTGLSKTFSGEGFGEEAFSHTPILAPVLTYEIQLPPECDVYGMFLKLRQLEEEEPQLHLIWNEHLNEIHAQIMGEIEIEILKCLIQDRFGVSVEFGSGSIVYKETILEPVLGVGHFEPLRHYAEVHLLLEPNELGSGIQFENRCSEDVLDRNWQRLIFTHLKEKKHKGVLTGSEITDIKITLIAGKAHKKHTEGGDFRQATYRAVRQGLKKAKSILLEPVYEYQLELPVENIGRAMSDIQRMNGTFQPFETIGNMAVLTGSAPVAAMRDYQKQVNSYTKGQGRLFCSLKGYEPCYNADEIITAIGYDSEQDLENPTSSVFCMQGSGFLVGWDEVERYMHMETKWSLGYSSSDLGSTTLLGNQGLQEAKNQKDFVSTCNTVDEKELEAIFQRTYGPVKRERPRYKRRIEAAPVQEYRSISKAKTVAGNREKYLLVDGYNIIFAWKELKDLASDNLDAAREQLIDILSNFKGYREDLTVIVVFDAYGVVGGLGSVTKQNNIHVIFTKEAETADQYIERAVNQMGRKHEVTVATSDNLVQMIIWGDGAIRLSAQGLKDEIEAASAEIKALYQASNHKNTKHYPLKKLGEKLNRE